MLEIAILAAQEAGKLIKSKANSEKNVATKSSNVDLVTDVDQQAEKIICEIIQKKYPQHTIIGEEGSTNDSFNDTRGYLWIIDPIDGTTNFIHGVPFYAVSIGLVYNNDVVLGVVYDPSSEELFSAQKGQGAFLNGEPIKVSEEKTIAESLMSSDFPNNKYRKLTAKSIENISTKCRNLRAPGSTALQMAYVAAGRYSGYWELGLKAWDMVAGALLVQEAGGRVSDTLNNSYSLDVSHVVATNGFIHDELIGILKSNQTTGFEIE